MPPKRKSTASGKAAETDNNSAGDSGLYIPERYIKNLDQYKYHGSDSSIMSRYVMCHYWNFAINLVPMTIAPNVLTLSGFVVGISSSFVLLYYFFFEAAAYPAWAWFYAAFAFFFYQTLDALDGKQARRTKTGSALGELFDHGCDAFLTPFVQMNATLALDMPPWMRYAFMLASSIGLFTSIWEQFATGTLDLGYISAPTEGALLLCVVFILTGLGGTAMWSAPVIAPLELTVGGWVVHLESVRSLVFTFFALAFVVTVLTNIAHALVLPTVHKSKAVPLRAFVPPFVLTVLHVVLYALYPSVARDYPMCLELSFGLVMTNTVTGMILARLSLMPFRFFSAFTVLTYVVTVGFVAVRVAGVVTEAEAARPLGCVLAFLAVFGAVSYGRMIVSVFRQIARYLGIKILSIPPPSSKAD